jgi:hypothetical protein
MIVDSLGRHSLEEDFMVDWTDPGFEVEVYTCIGWRRLQMDPLKIGSKCRILKLKTHTSIDVQLR